MTTAKAFAEARAIREAEKARYIEANAENLPDVKERWRKYEDSMIDKYCGKDRRLYGAIQHALDEAWIARDKHIDSLVG